MTAESLSRPVDPLSEAELKESSRKVGLLAFLSSVVMLFATFTAAFLVRRTGTDWKPLEMPEIMWISTWLLIGSSVTIEISRVTGRKMGLLVTLGLGLAFLFCQVKALSEMGGFSGALAENPHFSFIFVLLLVHALHLLGGIGGLFLTSLSSSRFGWVVTYWHFMGLVWIYVLVLLFLS
ncbi:MAG: hypothetical protein QF752_01820 [Planctomycetota bacterium]|jgi:cytochrome c oxidase subunit 3|nr:hypothetical protein [Planctomycetota bacterium]